MAGSASVSSGILNSDEELIMGAEYTIRKFKNYVEPIDEYDIDAEEFNEIFDNIISGKAFLDGLILIRHLSDEVKTYIESQGGGGGYWSKEEYEPGISGLKAALSEDLLLENTKFIIGPSSGGSTTFEMLREGWAFFIRSKEYPDDYIFQIDAENGEGLIKIASAEILMKDDQFDIEGQDLRVKDQNLSAFVNISEAGVSALNPYNAKTSIIGIMNEHSSAILPQSLQNAYNGGRIIEMQDLGHVIDISFHTDELARIQFYTFDFGGNYGTNIKWLYDPDTTGPVLDLGWINYSPMSVGLMAKNYGALPIKFVIGRETHNITFEYSEDDGTIVSGRFTLPAVCQAGTIKFDGSWDADDGSLIKKINTNDLKVQADEELVFQMGYEERLIVWGKGESGLWDMPTLQIGLNYPARRRGQVQICTSQLTSGRDALTFFYENEDYTDQANWGVFHKGAGGGAGDPAYLEYRAYSDDFSNHEAYLKILRTVSPGTGYAIDKVLFPNGAVEITDSLKIIGNIGFFGTAPVSQRLKANYNNWAALSDIVNALVDLGLFDQA